MSQARGSWSAVLLVQAVLPALVAATLFGLPAPGGP
jgi:hypothetical protein